MKFHVGDIVKANEKSNAKYTITRLGNGWIGEVTKIHPHGEFDAVTLFTYDAYFVGKEFCGLEEECFNPIETRRDEKIIITSDGKTTTARLIDGKKTVKTATANCSPNDTFDFKTGAKIAFERLTEDDKPVKQKHLNGKVICIESAYPWWTVGKVYDVVDGIITADDGDTYPPAGQLPYKDYADVRHAGCGDHEDTRHNIDNEFIEFKG